MDFRISGRIESADGDSSALGECRVELFFEQQVSPELPRSAFGLRDEGSSSSNGSDQKTKGGRVSTRTDEAGSFAISLPTDQLFDNAAMLQFVVSGPAGRITGLAHFYGHPEIRGLTDISDCILV